MAVSTESRIEARLDELESRVAIEELLADYAQGFDQQDADRLRTIWHEDAEFDLGDPFGSYSGIDSIMEATAGFWKQMKWMNHWMATPSIKVSGDHATGMSGVDCMVHDNDRGPSMICGTYTDEYERRDGVWKFAKRRFVMNYFTPLKNWTPDLGQVAD
jgi:ketosteroid isomerase-like protein